MKLKNVRPIVLNYGFDPFTQTPGDIMHILLKGICRRIVMIFFEKWMSIGRSTVDEINARFSLMEWGYTHKKTKIQKLSEFDLKKKNLIIKASQMRSLMLLFPFIFNETIL